MSENALHQNVEIEYINFMLNVSESRAVETEETIVCDDVYQLLLVAGFNVAILASDISSIHAARSYEVMDQVLIQGEDQFNIINIGHFINPCYDFGESGEFVILKDNKTALTCERVLGKETIDKDFVCWRDVNSKRKWLAGTLKNKNIILLDIMSLQND